MTAPTSLAGQAAAPAVHARRAPGAVSRHAGALAALFVADLRQRTRGTRFLVALAVAAVTAWGCFPPLAAHYLIVAVGDHSRGFYSSAWIGMVLALCTMLWSTIGFYVVRGTVRRDFDTRVWQLLGASPLARAAYLLAKWASHVVVLLALLGVTLLVGLAAQAVRAEDRHLDLVEFLKPSLFIALPMLCLCATFAIWFDLLPPLRRTAGNVVFFFAWMALMAGGGLTAEHRHDGKHALPRWSTDLPGIALVESAIDTQVAPQFPGESMKDGFCVGCGGVTPPARRFTWTRWDAPAAALWPRLAWIALALAATLLATPLLDWAAAHGSAHAPAAGGGRAPRTLRWLRVLLGPLRRSPFGTLVAAELANVLRLRAGWWWLAWIAAWIVQLAAPRHEAALAMLASWTLLLDVFSRAGLREREHGTAALVLTSPGAARRLLAARVAMLGGLALAAVLPALLRHPGLAPNASVLAASLSLWGLAAAAVARSSRPYELVFIAVAWATIQGLPWLDASTRASGTIATHLLGIPVALVLLRLRWAATLRG